MFNPINLLLADDDKDDCMLFNEALGELPILTNLTIVNNGEQLMKLLFKKEGELPSVLFLDLNMPRKNGFECLTEIRQNQQFNNLQVIIYSTSFDIEMVNLLYNNGAQHYIRKPADFTDLKQIIHNALILTTQTITSSPGKEKFVLEL